MPRRHWKRAIKLTLGIVVVLAVGWQVLGTWRRLARSGQTFRIDLGWLAASVGCYLAGLCGFGAFFWRIMASSRTPIGPASALRAYLISHLGKYVPGKALVVVMRAGLIVPYGARAATGAFATLYETLVMMTAGALVALLGFAFWGGRPMLLPALLAGGLAIGFLVAVDPRVFGRLSALARMPFPRVGPEAMPRISHRLLAEGLLLAAAGWLLLGLSQLAEIRALGLGEVGPSRWPIVIGGVALATVAGFAIAILPGGLGVREWVLWTTLDPVVGHDRAVVSALGLRLTWIVGEALAAAVLYVARPPLPVVGEP